MTEARRGEEKPQPKKELAVIVMGSPSDKGHAEKIKKIFDEFGIESHLRVRSAHKSTEALLEMIKEYDAMEDRSIAYIAVAGRSNGLGPVIDGNTINPVVSAPPLNESGFEAEDLWSSVRLPKGMAATTAIFPDVAALSVVKHFALNNSELVRKYQQHQQKLEEGIVQADREIDDK